MWQIIRIASMSLCVAALAACSPMVDNRGHVGASALVADIKVGKSTKSDVLQLLGSPSSTSDFGEESWYYISARKESKAFFKPKVVEQKVVRITFDRDAVVTKVDAYDAANLKQVEMVSKVTPTEGHELGFFEQIIGNVGRFSKKNQANTGTLKRDRSKY